MTLRGMVRSHCGTVPSVWAQNASTEALWLLDVIMLIFRGKHEILPILTDTVENTEQKKQCATIKTSTDSDRMNIAGNSFDH